MRILIFLIASLVFTEVFSQKVEFISNERAIKLIDSLKKVPLQAFEHILATCDVFENTESHRNNFERCINTISKGYRFPLSDIDETTGLTKDGEVPWSVNVIDYGVNTWKQNKETSQSIIYTSVIWLFTFLNLKRV